MEVYTVLVRVVDAMRKQRAVTIAPIEQRLTTQQAADLLGISRPTLIKLVGDGILTCEKPGNSRHRRLRLADVLDYQQRLRAERNELLTQLIHDAEDNGLYDVPNEQLQQAVKRARAEHVGRS